MKTIKASILILFSSIALANDHICLAKNMYFEARGDGSLAMLLVGQVTMNRVESKRYPDSVCSVVTQPKQFSWMSDGLSDSVPVNDSSVEKEKWDVAQSLAKTLLYEGNALNDLTEGSLHYHNHSVNPIWNREMNVSLVHVGHIFYNKEK